MKGFLIAFFVLLVSLIAVGQQSSKHCTTKSPCGPMVRVDQVRTDDDGLTVWMSSPTTVYVLTCAIVQKTCLTPATDTDYELIDRGEKLSVLKDFYGAYPHAPTVGLVDSGDVGIYALVKMVHRTTKRVAQ